MAVLVENTLKLMSGRAISTKIQEKAGYRTADYPRGSRYACARAQVPRYYAL